MALSALSYFGVVPALQHLYNAGATWHMDKWRKALTLAMVFPGQGSQSIGMQADLAQEFPEVLEVYAEASEQLGFDLWQAAQAGPQEKLDETEITQPVMLSAGVAAWKAWHKAGGPRPAQLAGHSLGEYTALVCAGALEFADAIRLVRKRAELMQSAVPAGTGAMAALLGLEDDAVIEVCQQAAAGEVVSAVNFNAPGQVVIAGDKSAVERANEMAKAAGAKRAIMLSVSVPSHCALMTNAAAELMTALDSTRIADTAIPVVSNVDVLPYSNSAEIRDGLYRQVFSPVRWVESIRYLVSNGADQLVECGPGKVLAGLTRRIDRSLATGFVENPESLSKALQLSV